MLTTGSGWETGAALGVAVVIVQEAFGFAKRAISRNGRSKGNDGQLSRKDVERLVRLELQGEGLQHLLDETKAEVVEMKTAQTTICRKVDRLLVLVEQKESRK